MVEVCVTLSNLIPTVTDIIVNLYTIDGTGE